VIFPLGQTSSSTDHDWTQWVLAIVAVLTLIQTIFSPFVRHWMKEIFARLERGDEKFDQQGEKLTRVETIVEGVKGEVQDMRSELRSTGEKQVNFKIDGMGAIQEARVEMRKEFVSREEFERHQDEARDRHREVMEAIAQLGRQRR
jgi:hypothetical protein